ncbi:MAG: hypothetical protein A2998_00520 [Candidatus Staskawiczbacteria bacterium RIFCSPLOWO2_01_FULL_37_25b]|uniref:GH18 domain-containing protein n=2 Tax=Candidatus Staskawicziibacteriota TaxID=1817916 RepID=A0A1G2HJR3_9BACT|nr:MAG: hypothetical protein A2812_00420 [Candidatus Staskawiczbacteria bacterium RIFCSPHIGHO2_01_FULL_36_16]OGZ71781.1 MAG: hypothetical protein A2998_00520 [Candidatus Staskawiczbacteria bacterium RIFCSPLOWO2_01_FULL_37_25b]
MKKIIYFLILFLFLTPVSAFGMEKIFYVSQSSEKTAIPAIQKNAEKIDILAPQAYAVKSDLNLYGSLSPKLQQAIKDYNIKVMPLVVNSLFSQKTIHNLLLSQSAQDKVIAGFVQLAKKNNYIGWQFDFENISHKDKDLYSAFVEKTAKELHKNNLILSIAAVSRTTDFEDTNAYYNWGGVYDYKRISNAVDFISLMTYDDSKSYGPTASTLFVKWVLDYVKDKIPAEKLSMGIPFYYWGWNQKTLKRVSSGGYNLVKVTMDNFPCKLGFDESLGVPWLTYSTGKKSYKIWYENKKSFEIKLNTVKDNNFRGFSAWVLGAEDPEIWSAL